MKWTSNEKNKKVTPKKKMTAPKNKCRPPKRSASKKNLKRSLHQTRIGSIITEVDMLQVNKINNIIIKCMLQVEQSLKHSTHSHP